MRKAQKLIEKFRLEHDREGPSRDTPVQEQRQVIEESNIRQQLVQKQKEGISVPQVSQNPNRSIELDKGTIPKYVNSLQTNEAQVPFYPDPIMKPPPRLTDKKIQNDGQMNLDLDIEINKDFEENSPYQEGIISEIYQRLLKSQLIGPPELADLIDTNQIIQKYLSKQTDIDKMLKVIQRKVLKGIHLPVTVKEIQAGYLNSPHFKDVYLYLTQKKLPSSKNDIHKVEALEERYIILDSLLFKLNLEKEGSLSYIRNVCRSDN